MIVETKENTIQSNGVQLTQTMGIKKEGMGFIQNILRSNIYSNKIKSCIREIVCNAVDSHVEADKAEVPIQVTLPSRFCPTLRIRDFGVGMSEKTILDIYSFFGLSTKRNTNLQTGFMGIGKVAPLAYGDSFTLVSFHGGIKSTYNVYVDCESLTQVARLAQETTNEGNGVEIAVSVKDCDVCSFVSSANEVFRYMKVKPIVDGKPWFNANPTAPIMSGSDWKVFGNQSESLVVMGNVAYKIDDHFQDANISKILKSAIEVDFEIGELSVSASRESLEFNPRTKQAVVNKLTRITAEIVTQLNDKFTGCKTFFDACKLYGSVMNYGSPFGAFRDLVKTKIVFNGKTVTCDSIRFFIPSDFGFTVREYDKSWRGIKIRGNNVHRIECAENTVVIDNDLGASSGIVNRIHNLVTGGKRVFVLSYVSAANKAKFLLETGLEECNLTPISSLPKITLAISGGQICKNAKHTSKEFIYDFDFATKNRYRFKSSDYWKQESVDIANDAGLYVIIDKFEYTNGEGSLTSPGDLNGIISAMKDFGIDIKKIYGFKNKIKDEVVKNPKMTNLFAYLSNELSSYFAKNNISQKISNRIEFDAFEDKYSWMSFFLKNWAKASPKTVLHSVGALVSHLECAADKKVLDQAVHWKKYYTPVLPEHSMESLAKQIQDKYPLITLVDFGWRFDDRKYAVAALLEYVNLIDG